MKEEELQEKVLAVIREHIDESVRKIELHSHLEKEFSLDSVAILEIIFVIEDFFHINITNQEATKLQTPSDAVILIQQKLSV